MEHILRAQGDLLASDPVVRKMMGWSKIERNPMRLTSRQDPHEVWRTKNDLWTWYVLKKYQKNDLDPKARWFCYKTSPFEPLGEYEDVYVEDIIHNANRIR